MLGKIRLGKVRLGSMCWVRQGQARFGWVGLGEVRSYYFSRIISQIILGSFPGSIPTLSELVQQFGLCSRVTRLNFQIKRLA